MFIKSIETPSPHGLSMDSICKNLAPGRRHTFVCFRSACTFSFFWFHSVCSFPPPPFLSNFAFVRSRLFIRTGKARRHCFVRKGRMLQIGTE